MCPDSMLHPLGHDVNEGGLWSGRMCYHIYYHSAQRDEVLPSIPHAPACIHGLDYISSLI